MPPPPPPSAGSGQDLDTRERLLAAGAELFAQKGFHGCGLSEVLRHAGVPKGSFYHWFGSKEEFGVALIERTRDEYMDLVRPLLDDRETPALTRLRQAFEAGRQHADAEHSTDVCLVTRLALDAGGLSEPIETAVRTVHRQWNALLAEVIREAQSAGELAGPDEPGHQHPDQLADLLVMLWEGATVRARIERASRPFDGFLDFVFGSLLARR